MKIETDETDTRKEDPEDKTFFVPMGEIRNIENVIDNLETTRRELQKVREGMKPIESS